MHEFSQMMRAVVFSAAALLLSVTGALAQSLETLLPETVETHDRVLASKADVAAAKSRAREALGDWYPVLETTANYGWEKQQKHETANTSTAFKELDLSLTQLLWDFGKTNAAVEQARLDLETARATLAKTRRDLILEAASAYVNVIRAREVLDYAKRSEENIRKQTGLEAARIESGSGLKTDELQAKRELAAAEARRIESEGSLVATENRFLAVFGFVPEDSSALNALPQDAFALPGSVEEALAGALEKNPDLILARIDEDNTRQDIRAARAEEFLPSIEGTVERKWKNNVGGTLEFKGETLAKVEMSVPINLGLTGLDTIDASKADLVSKQRTLADTRRTVEETVRTAWQKLNTARAKARALRNQEDIAKAFLDLARQERAIGQRSLIDVLSGETALINAQSDAVSAETDVLVAAFDLLSAVGELGYDTFGAVAPKPKPNDESLEAVEEALKRQPKPGRRRHLTEETEKQAALTEPPLTSRKRLRIPETDDGAPPPTPVPRAAVEPASEPLPEPQSGSMPVPEAAPGADADASAPTPAQEGSAQGGDGDFLGFLRSLKSRETTVAPSPLIDAPVGADRAGADDGPDLVEAVSGFWGKLRDALPESEKKP